MTIEDQIRDEKVHGRLEKYQLYHQVKLIIKYEYLTGEKILPSNQQQIIEQAKFTYSPVRKAFEKQTKIIKDQLEKQIKAIRDNKEQLNNINNDDDYKIKLLLSKEREILKKSQKNKRLDKIEELSKKNDYNNLKYIAISIGEEFEFDESEDPKLFLNNTEKCKILLEEAKYIQQD